MLGELLAMWLMGNLGAACQSYDSGTPPSKPRPQLYDWCAHYLDDPYGDNPPRVGVDLSLGAQVIVEYGDSFLMPENYAPVGGSGVNTFDMARFIHKKRRDRAVTLGRTAPRQYMASRFDILQLAELERAVRRNDLLWKCIVPPQCDLDCVETLLDSNNPEYQLNLNFGGTAGPSSTGCKNAAGSAVACEFVETTVASEGGIASATGDGLLKELCTQGGGSTCNTAYKRANYYIARNIVDRHNEVDGTNDGKWELAFTGVEFNLNDQDCVNWAVANAQRMLAQGGFDGIQLNHKDAHYFWLSSWSDAPVISLSSFKSAFGGATGCTDDTGTGCNGLNWMEGPLGPNPNGVDAGANMVETPFSSVPSGCARGSTDLHKPYTPDSGNSACVYRYTDYWHGEKLLSDSLTAAGVHYSFLPTQQMLDPNEAGRDDPNTVGLNERDAYIAPVAAGATRLSVDFVSGGPVSDDLATIALYPNLMPIDTTCGKRNTATADCYALGTNSVLFTVPTIVRTGTSVSWVPMNGALTPTGTWSGTIFCDCTAVNGTVDPTAAGCTGGTNASAKPDGTAEVTTCPAASGDRIAVTVTQGTETFWTWLDVP